MGQIVNKKYIGNERKENKSEENNRSISANNKYKNISTDNTVR